MPRAKFRRNDEFHRTAFHEAGHAFYYLRDGSYVESIFIDKDFPFDGECIGGHSNSLIPGNAESSLQSSRPTDWLKWKREAVFEIIETLAGPLAELHFRGTKLDAPLYKRWKQQELFEEFDNDFERCERILEVWLQLASRSRSASQERISWHLRKIESYVRGRLIRRSNWSYVEKIVKLIVTQNGSVDSADLRKLRIPKRTRIPADLLEFP